eukprot:4092729-Amphidinium_carterae.1
MDEKFDFVDGFILPGRLAVNEETRALSKRQLTNAPKCSNAWGTQAISMGVAWFHILLKNITKDSSKQND